MTPRIYSVAPSCVTPDEPSPGWYIGHERGPIGPFDSHEDARDWWDEIGDGEDEHA